MGVKREIWTGRVRHALTTKGRGQFLDKIEDLSRYVQNDVIHQNKLTTRPSVLINNTVFPIPRVAQGDVDIPLGLNSYTSVNTKITDDELNAISYPKIDESIKLHVEVIQEKIIQHAIWGIAPDASTANTPLVSTTGAGAAGYKEIVKKDILSAKAACDLLELPEKGRVLVLSTPHLNQLLAIDDRFEKQYYDFLKGELPPLFMGFEIFSYISNPYYTAANAKKALGSAVISTDKQASVFFHTDGVFKCLGSTKMYGGKPAEDDPDNEETAFHFKQRALIAAIEQAMIGAIVAG